MITVALIAIIVLLMFLCLVTLTLANTADQLLRIIARELTEREQENMSPTERIFNV